MKRIIEIRGKKYEWRPENVHPALLISAFMAGLGAAVVGFWSFCIVTVGLLG